MRLELLAILLQRLLLIVPSYPVPVDMDVSLHVVQRASLLAVAHSLVFNRAVLLRHCL